MTNMNINREDFEFILVGDVTLMLRTTSRLDDLTCLELSCGDRIGDIEKICHEVEKRCTKIIARIKEYKE